MEIKNPACGEHGPADGWACPKCYDALRVRVLELEAERDQARAEAAALESTFYRMRECSVGDSMMDGLSFCYVAEKALGSLSPAPRALADLARAAGTLRDAYEKSQSIGACEAEAWAVTEAVDAWRASGAGG